MMPRLMNEISFILCPGTSTLWPATLCEKRRRIASARRKVLSHLRKGRARLITSRLIVKKTCEETRGVSRRREEEVGTAAGGVNSRRCEQEAV